MRLQQPPFPLMKYLHTKAHNEIWSSKKVRGWFKDIKLGNRRMCIRIILRQMQNYRMHLERDVHEDCLISCRSSVKWQFHNSQLLETSGGHSSSTWTTIIEQWIWSMVSGAMHSGYLVYMEFNSSGWKSGPSGGSCRFPDENGSGRGSTFEWESIMQSHFKDAPCIGREHMEPTWDGRADYVASIIISRKRVIQELRPHKVAAQVAQHGINAKRSHLREWVDLIPLAEAEYHIHWSVIESDWLISQLSHGLIKFNQQWRT